MGHNTSQQWVSYLTSIVAGRHRLGKDRMQELRTLAECLNMLGEGNLPGLADMLTQRFKSLELDAAGHGELSRSVELVDSTQMGLTSSREMLSATRSELMLKKLSKTDGGRVG